MFCLCGAVGQNFIFFTISTFGSLVNTTVTTTRKFVNILLSVFINGTVLGAQQWGGAVSVFAGIGLSVALKQRKKKVVKKAD